MKVVAVTQLVEQMNFNIGNAVKYLCRAGLKGDAVTTDIAKAAWHCQRELQRLGEVIDNKPSGQDKKIARLIKQIDEQAATIKNLMDGA